ncbi:MAG: carbohydrate binding domain-containing protein, partial [Candidatus Margulisiibacteriota bacterium]
NAPNGGETLNIDSNYNITWSAGGVTNVRIRYSTDGGTSWNVIIATTPAAAGTYQWMVPNAPTTHGRVEVSDASTPTLTDASNADFTIAASQQATTLVIDDIEGTSVLPNGYYVLAPSPASNPTQTRITTDKHEGTYAMNTTYPAISDSTNAWRGWGGTFVATKDVSAYDTLSIWVKGDGSPSNKLKVQFKDASNNNFGLQDTDAIALSSNGWAEYRIGGFKAKMTRVPGTADHGVMDWAKVTEYQVVFSGTDASAGVMVDYVNVTNVAPTTEVAPHIMSITPTNGGEKITVTITGSNFASSGGLINFAGGGTTTSIKTSDTGSLITSWADGQIVLSLPGMSKGVKTVNIVRADNTPSDNSVTFEVTAIATGSGTSYNYPNPFNPLGGEKTIIVFDPGTAANVTVYIFDMTAKQMAKINWSQSEPAAQVIWDGKNIYDEIVGDGVYLYRIVDTGSGKMIGKGKILAVNK